jgi:hypothetical protein
LDGESVFYLILSSLSVNLALTLPSLGLGIRVLINALLVKNFFYIEGNLYPL